MKRLIFICIVFSSLLFSSTNLDLTKEEKTYIKNKKVLIVSSEKNYEPFDFIKDGKPSGISIDLLELLLKDTGLKIRYVTKPWSDLVTDFENKKIDLLHSLYRTPQREKNTYFQNPICLVAKLSYITVILVI